MVSALALIGALMTVGSGVGYYVIPGSFKMMLPKVLNLAEDGMLFPVYKEPPFALSSRYYLYEVKNRKEFLRGAKLKIGLKGPYIFITHMYRDNVAFKNGQTSVKYDTHRVLVPDEARSANFDEKMWALNPIVVGVGDQVRAMVTGRVPFKRIVEPIVFNSINVFLGQFKESLLSYTTPREYLVGKKVEFLEFLTNLANRFGAGSLLPPGPPNNIFGVVYAQNETYDRQEIYTGVGNSASKFAEVISWRDKQEMNIWKGRCNKIEGTNGELYKPFTNPNKSIRIFLGPVCRSLWLDPDGGPKKLHNGLIGAKFELSKSLFQGTKNNSANECYCTNLKSYDCRYDGLFAMGPCYFNAPIFFARPHLKGMNRKIRSFIDDEIVDDDKLPGNQHFVLDPITGTPLVVNMSFVGIFKVLKQPYMRDLSNIQNVTYAPVFATTESLEIPAEVSNQLKALQILYFEHKTICVLGGIGGLGTLLFARFASRRKRKVEGSTSTSTKKNGDDQANTTSDTVVEVNKREDTEV